MTLSKLRRRTKSQDDNRFFLYVMFYNFFSGFASIFKDD